jgi:tetratricopeptide (TPR) repeat protein
MPDQYNHRVALYGLGGVGKTQLALEYIYRHWQSKTYERIYWVSAVSQATLFKGLQEIGVRTHCLSETMDLKPSDIAAKVLRWLNSQEKWLFILDNLDDVTVVDGYLPETAPERHTIITTRNQHCDDIPAEGLEVGVLSIPEATQLLLKRAKISGSIVEMPEKEKEASEIVKELGSLPLAIDQAAAYIREASNNIFKFLPSYRQNRKFYHGRTSKGNRMYSKSLATTWSLSFEQVQRNSNEAAELLKLLAFLNPDGVLIEFLEAGKEGLTPELQNLVADENRLSEALAELTRFSLIGRQDDGSPRITIHRLVQSIIQDDMSPPEFSAMTTTVIGFCASGFPVSKSSAWEILEIRQLGRKYQDQVVLPLRALGMITSDEMANLLVRVGIFLGEDGNYAQARELLAKAVEIMEILEGGETDETLLAVSELAMTYWYEGKWDDAQKLEERVLEVRARSWGQENPHTMTAMANLAATYRDQGKLDDAQKLQERVLEVNKRSLGQEHPDRMKAMANLAMTYWYEGKWDDAQKLQERVLEVNKRSLGQEHPDTLMAMAHLGSTYRTLGAISTSIEFLEMALDKANRILGHEHPNTLWMGVQLALAHQVDGRLGDAIRLLEHTFETEKRILGEEHPETKQTATYLERAQQYQRKGTCR